MRLFFLILVLLFSQTSVASECKGHFANPVTDVCWRCLFPLSIGSAKVVSSRQFDPGNPKSPVCACGTRVGLAVGFWEPISLVDVTHKPFCMVNLGGFQMNLGSKYKAGSQNTRQGLDNKSFYHVHWYKFPLMVWLNMLISTACVQAGEFDVAYLSELDPSWNSEGLALLLSPEAVLFGNPIAQSACAADAISATTRGKALNSLFWCAGAHGSLYPMTGTVQEHVSGVQASSLLAERLATKLHRDGLLWDSRGADGEALCRERPHPVIPKDRYRLQMTYPYAMTNAKTGCHAFGASSVLWESGKEYPIKGEDFGYLVWRKRNCCAF